MSFPTHLTCHNSHFYYQARIPVDLKKYFRSSSIKKSLKTKNFNDAKMLLIALEYKIGRAFTSLRTGMLSEDLIARIVEEIQPEMTSYSII